MGTLPFMLAGMGASALGNIFGSISRRNAAKQAGTVLNEAANREAQSAMDRVQEVNPYIKDAYLFAQHAYSPVANASADTVMQTAQQGAEGANAAAREANTYLNPYMQAGTDALDPYKQAAIKAGQGFSVDEFDPSVDVTMDPGYAFRLAEGQKAMERSAAARGTLASGGTLKALTRYGQDAASQEYANAFNRKLEGYKANLTGKLGAQDLTLRGVATLGDLVRTGAGASQQAGANLTGAAQYGGTLQTGAATTGGGWRNNAALQEGNWQIQSAQDQAKNLFYGDEIARQLRLQGSQATANSILGAANAGADMWGGLGNTVGQGLTLWGMMNRDQKGASGGGASGGGGGAFDWLTGGVGNFAGSNW